MAEIIKGSHPLRCYFGITCRKGVQVIPHISRWLNTVDQPCAIFHVDHEEIDPIFGAARSHYLNIVIELVNHRVIGHHIDDASQDHDHPQAGISLVLINFIQDALHIRSISVEGICANMQQDNIGGVLTQPIFTTVVIDIVCDLLSCPAIMALVFGITEWESRDIAIGLRAHKVYTESSSGE